MRVLVAAGGSGGHVYPALAVFEELMARGELSAAGWVGSAKGIEREIVSTLPWVRYHVLPSRGLPRKRPWTWPLALAVLGWSVVKAVLLVRAFRPDVVLGMGGYPAFGPCVAARLLRIPLVVHEQNARMGLVNRLLSFLADAVLTSFADPSVRQRSSAVATGNPVRRAIAQTRAALGRELFVFGGSQGSSALGEATLRAAPALAKIPELELRLVVGRAADPDAVRRMLCEAGLERATVLTYEPEMAEALSRARLVVARAGATTVAEVAAAGRPSVLVPWSGAADDHQMSNALALAHQGAGLVLSDGELRRSDMADIVARLWEDEATLTTMAARARAAARPDAAERVADVLVALGRRKG